MSIQLNYLGSPVKYGSEWLYYFESEISIPALALYGGMQADCDIQLQPMSIAGAFATDGNISLPAVLISGKMRDVIDGLVALWGTLLDGDITVTARLDGDVVMPAISVDGGMQAEGSIMLEAMRVSGQITQYGVITGAVTLPLIGVAGSAIQGQESSGSIVMPIISMSGVMAQSGGAAFVGSVSLPRVQILGLLALYEDHSFGSEIDAVLKFNASRRLI